jgi:hypothetical protein
MVLKTKKSKSAKELSSADLEQSATDQLDQVIASLKAKRQSWAQLPISASIKIIDEILETLPETEPQWMESGLSITGGQPGSLSHPKFGLIFQLSTAIFASCRIR